jgi:hypothetical protein
MSSARLRQSISVGPRSESLVFGDSRKERGRQSGGTRTDDAGPSARIIPGRMGLRTILNGSLAGRVRRRLIGGPSVAQIKIESETEFGRLLSSLADDTVTASIH